MPNVYPAGSFPSISIHTAEPLPDTCINCGMFTDHRVRSKFVSQHQTTVTAGDSNSKVALGCLLHLLGPIGLLVAAILGGGGDQAATTEKTVTKKFTIKVPCCKLCAGQQVPEAIDGAPDGSHFVFTVHSRFADHLATLRQQAIDNA